MARKPMPVIKPKKIGNRWHEDFIWDMVWEAVKTTPTEAMRAHPEVPASTFFAWWRKRDEAPPARRRKVA